jgi:hypothetical protein
MFADANQGLLVAGIVALLLVASEAGFRRGAANRERYDSENRASLSTIQAATLALFGLLLAFAVNMAVGRYEARHQLVVSETAAMEVALLRSRLLPSPQAERSRELLREYVGLKARIVNIDISRPGLDAKLAEVERLQEDLWRVGVAAAAIEKNVFVANYLQALTDVAVLHDQRVAARLHTIPDSVIFMILLFGVFAGFELGMTSGFSVKHTRKFVAAYAIVAALLISVILDLNRPTGGLIQVSADPLERLLEKGAAQ